MPVISLGGNVTHGAGRVNEEFLELLGKDREAFSRLSSDLKVWLYRASGAAIGRGVVMSPGSVISSPCVHIGDEVFIGKDVTIECDALVVGRLTHIGDGSILKARRITLGENVFLYRDVEIGGGGGRDAEAEIEISSHCHIGQGVHLNCCRKITIGEESTITMGAAVMTHAFANSVLEGYPAVFAPVEIGRNVQIGIRSVIFPGVRIGDGAVVGNHSSVIGDIPPGCYAAGVPARKVGNARRDLAPERRRAIALEMVHEFIRQLSLNQIATEDCPDPSFALAAARITHRSGSGLLVFLEQASQEDVDRICSTAGQTPQEIVCVCLKWAGERRSQTRATIIDLLDKWIEGPGGPITETLREFLRKRGIRLEPRTWTYRGGIL